MKKTLLPMMLLAMATSVNAQNLTSKTGLDVNLDTKAVTAKTVESPKKAESDDYQIVGYNGSDTPTGLTGFATWQSASMIMSDLKGDGVLADYKGYDIVGLRFCVSASLGESAAICAFIYKSENDEGTTLAGSLNDNYTVSPVEDNNVNVTWNTIGFPETHTITGEETEIIYGYQYTQKTGDGSTMDENPVMFGKSESTAYSNMFCVYGVPGSNYKEGLYYVSSKENPYVPCFQLVLQKGNQTAIVGLNGSEQPVGKEYFSLNGARLSAPQKGVNIVKMSDGTTKKVVVK